MNALIIYLVSFITNFSFLPHIALTFPTYFAERLEEKHAIYLSIDRLSPAQLRYSSQNVKEKIAEILENAGAIWNEEEKKWDLAFDQGRSALPESEALPVIKGAQGYILADGHHHALASLSLKSLTIPVYVIADFSSLDEEKFWQEAENQGWAYLVRLNGEKSSPPKNFHDLEDDPNRYFAAISARKYSADTAGSKGSEYPLWIKIGKDVPFIEFKISDALRQRGIEYRYEMGKDLPEDFIERARAALQEAHIPGLKLVPKRMHHTEIDPKN